MWSAAARAERNEKHRNDRAWLDLPPNSAAPLPPAAPTPASMPPPRWCSGGSPRPADPAHRVAEPVLEMLPEFLQHEGVLAVGELGYDAITEAEEKAYIAQAKMAIEHDLPILVHTPHRDKARGTQRSIDVLKDLGANPDTVVIDHSTERRSIR